MIEIKNFSEKYLAQVAKLYDVVFTDPEGPWKDEPLGLEVAIAYITKELAKPLAIGFLALLDELPVGFAWGYQLSWLGFAQSKYSTPAGQQLIASVQPDRSYFYISEVGVNPRYQKLGIGTDLTVKLAQDQNPLLMRTTWESGMRSVAINKVGMTSVISPALPMQDPENASRVILVKYD